MRTLLIAVLGALAIAAQPQVSPDRKITFTLKAENAAAVRVTGGDIPNNAKGLEMTKGAGGVWTGTTAAVPAGAYRYRFLVDGLSVIDPANPAISESNDNVWSLVAVPGSDVLDTREVPHGAVAAVTYYSSVLKRHRRMHVYTPPGYESGKGKYPVFYLLHGASDSDASWSTVGRAGFVLDNLIAAGKAKPMIMVMPAGHTTPMALRNRNADDFPREFLADILPYVDSHYRVAKGRANRAIAGLSMGGNHTLRIGLPNLGQFAYLGVFSSGLIGEYGTPRPGMPPRPAGPTFEEQHKAALDDAGLKKGLKLFWFGIGKDDFLLKTSQGTVEMLRKHGFQIESLEDEGGHTWLKWREYLPLFAAKLFQ